MKESKNHIQSEKQTEEALEAVQTEGSALNDSNDRENVVDADIYNSLFQEEYNRKYDEMKWLFLVGMRYKSVSNGIIQTFRQDYNPKSLLLEMTDAIRHNFQPGKNSTTYYTHFDKFIKLSDMEQIEHGFINMILALQAKYTDQTRYPVRQKLHSAMEEYFQAYQDKMSEILSEKVIDVNRESFLLRANALTYALISYDKNLAGKILKQSQLELDKYCESSTFKDYYRDTAKNRKKQELIEARPEVQMIRHNVDLRKKYNHSEKEDYSVANSLLTQLLEVKENEFNNIC